ncbi:hypothetical protein Q3G72_014238 [Acer saccharum]|nr:hypothetical protein Q3G72_014238 [Acer saccharum]
MAAVFNARPTNDEALTKPLRRYVTRNDEKTDGGGGNKQWVCNFCMKTYTSSYTRVKAHLLKQKGSGIGVCNSVTAEDFLEMQRLDNDAKEIIKSNAPKKIPLPPSSIILGESQKATMKKRKMSTSGSGSMSKIEKAFNLRRQEQLDGEIARMFYSGGLPFHLSRNPYYRSSYNFATSHSLPGYVPPRYNALRTTLLHKEKANVHRLLAPIRAKWSEKGVSIVSDGWSDSQMRPLINFMAVTDGQPMFLKAVDCSGIIKDKFFIANLLTEVINEIGHEKVVQVVTDNATNCKATGQIIEGCYPAIVWTPCVVHTLNLALKNICAAANTENNYLAYKECNWITDVVGDVSQIKNFIMNHGMRLAIFNEFVSLKLISVAKTRFASVIVMLKRFKLIKSGLQAMVISDKWSCYKEDDVDKAKFVKDQILDDFWWDSIDFIMSFTNPIYDMIRICDTNRSCLHLVYDMWDTMIEKVKNAIYTKERKREDETSIFYEVAYEILIDRWNKNNTPLHCLAHSLNPRYYSDQWLNEDPKRVSPHKDPVVSKERVKCFKKYFPNSDERNKVAIKYASFIDRSGVFGECDSITNRYDMDPKTWWLLHGSHAPLLQSIALKLLVQPSSSCAERNWSTYSFVHSVRRNKMTPQRAEDLVFIHSNLRLLSRKSDLYSRGESKMWGIAGDSFDSLEDVGLLEVANLSLDEPELDSVIFNDNEEADGGDAEETNEVETVTT